eukprot:8355070-Alexandrium_andersonii.AAC.1
MRKPFGGPQVYDPEAWADSVARAAQEGRREGQDQLRRRRLALPEGVRGPGAEDGPFQDGPGR